MGQPLLLLVVAVTVAAVVFGVTVLVTGRDPGLAPVEADGRAVPLPGDRPLRESDVGEVRFDTALRGYRMTQVDQAMRRAAYDIGYKAELIGVLEAEVTALRDGRIADADALRRAREQSANPAVAGPAPWDPPVADGSTIELSVAPAGAETGDRPMPAATTEAPTEPATAAGATSEATQPADGEARPAGGQQVPGAAEGAVPAAADPDADDRPADSGASGTASRGPVVRSESA
ncbi:DivIVA domain-containing protein [Verrucosispora sp. WMMC514]|uniref:DivIVA domain-containing protein n=1 Tax=Verrucosispora sp. WMMC514 TaxID=3015156 RepID=UPI00248CB584|nr:DivIVA domain-containing protein [Verrucosispora sp. WMMC514]WBB94277.1 DivIVA domain-containing protein [Verrucosispora sp. WMMC514]